MSQPPRCARCGTPAHNVNSSGEYTGQHLDTEERLRELVARVRSLENRVRNLENSRERRKDVE